MNEFITSKHTRSTGDVFTFDLQRFAAVCKIDNTEYETLQAAVDSVTDNTATTITLLADASGNGVNFDARFFN